MVYMAESGIMIPYLASRVKYSTSKMAAFSLIEGLFAVYSKLCCVLWLPPDKIFTLYYK